MLEPMLRKVKARWAWLNHHITSEGSTGIHYPIALPNLRAYNYLSHTENDFPKATKASQEIISLPMYPELDEEQIKYIRDTIEDLNSCEI